MPETSSIKDPVSTLNPGAPGRNVADDPEVLAKLCCEIASGKKAEQIVMLDLRGISTFTDFFVICNGASEPQLRAIANDLEDRLQKEHGVKPLAIDGFPLSQWVIADYGSVVVHVFHPEKRAVYNLEGLWKDAQRTNWSSAA
jgi:ribosome-associated protein